MDIQSKLSQLTQKFNENKIKGPMQMKTIQSGELYQKVQNAKDTEIYAPKAVEEAEKEYYTFTYGKVAYEKQLHKKFEKEATEVQATMVDTHNQRVTSTLEKLNYYESQHTYYNNLHRITETLMKQILQYLNKIKRGLAIDVTQQRETYYKNIQQVSTDDYIIFFQSLLFALLILQAIHFREYKVSLIATIVIFILMLPRIRHSILYHFITPKTTATITVLTEHNIIYRGQSKMA